MRNTRKKFGKILMMLGGAPQHRAKDVRDAIEELDGRVKLAYLPPSCPDLNAVEELWRQLKANVLHDHYTKYANMCNDLDEWLKHHLPSLDICRYFYRGV